MPAEIHVVPGTGTQLVASQYFYTDYDPTNHFTYNIVFNENNQKDNAKTNDNQLDAFRQVVEHHFSFEQVLPKENTEYVQFYTPIYNNGIPQDYTGIAEIDYLNITETELLQKVFKIPTKVEFSGQVKIDRQMEKDYNEMTLNELKNLYNSLKGEEPYVDATRWNIHCYQCALYCRVERPVAISFKKTNNNSYTKEITQAIDSNNQPMWYSSAAEAIKYTDLNGAIITKNNKYPIINYTNPFEFRQSLNIINSIFKTKIPSEDGWYRYDKLDKKWKFICKINPTTQLLVDNQNIFFDWADD